MDLSDAPKALAQLIHISYSMQAYDAAFVIKEWVDVEKTYGGVKEYLEQDKKMIAAFDYRGFLKKDEIYVGDPTFFGAPTIRAKAPIIIEDYSTNFYDDQTMFGSYVNRWRNSFVSYAGLTKAGTNSGFSKYMKIIKTGTTEFALIMYDILFGDRTNT